MNSWAFQVPEQREPGGVNNSRELPSCGFTARWQRQNMGSQLWRVNHHCKHNILVRLLGKWGQPRYLLTAGDKRILELLWERAWQRRANKKISVWTWLPCGFCSERNLTSHTLHWLLSAWRSINHVFGSNKSWSLLGRFTVSHVAITTPCVLWKPIFSSVFCKAS